jgi:hypothetical protein
MKNIDTLIDNLSKDLKPVKPVKSPKFYGGVLIALLVSYGYAAQCYLGFRSDLNIQFARGFFLAEILLLVGLFFSSAICSVISLYPDNYQKGSLLKIPKIFLAAFALLFLVQIFLPHDARMVILEGHDVHDIECTICIALASLIPSALIFIMLSRGVTSNPKMAGFLSVITASSIGCLTLRLAEDNDSLTHLLAWHYLPTVVFALLGAAIGKTLLRHC